MHCRISGGVITLDKKLSSSHLSSRAVKYGTNSFSILKVIRTFSPYTQISTTWSLKRLKEFL